MEGGDQRVAVLRVILSDGVSPMWFFAMVEARRALPTEERRLELIKLLLKTG